MHAHTELLKEDVKAYILRNPHASAWDVANHFNVSKSTVYDFVRILRDEMSGVMYVRGYVMSSAANKMDCCNWMKRLNYQKLSLLRGVNSTAPDVLRLFAKDKTFKTSMNKVVKSLVGSPDTFLDNTRRLNQMKKAFNQTKL